MSQRVPSHFSRALLAFAALGCSNTPSSAGAGGFPALGGAGTSGSPSAAAGSSAGGASAAGGAEGTMGGTPGAAGGALAGAGGAGLAGAGGASGGAAGTGQGGAAGAGGATGCKGATVCYDFEECKTPTGWTVPVYPTDPGEGNQGAGSILVDNEKAHGGMCSLHMKDFSGDQPQHALLAALPASFGPTLWGRAWVFNTAAPTNHGALIKLRYAIPNSTDVDWYEVGYEKQNYDGIWHSPLPPSGLPEWVLQSNTTIVLNNWTCVEWLFDTQNGTQPQAADPRIWQDGVEVTFKPGFEYDLNNPPPNAPRPTTPKGSNFVGMEVGLTMYHTIDTKTNIYMDDLALGSQRIGCN
jgi:hypothetical protein